MKSNLLKRIVVRIFAFVFASRDNKTFDNVHLLQNVPLPLKQCSRPACETRQVKITRQPVHSFQHIIRCGIHAEYVALRFKLEPF